MLSTVFYNQQRSGYEELLSYGPLFYRDLLEMDTNYRFAGKTLDVGAEGLEKLMQDQFIDTADEETISRWENGSIFFLIHRQISNTEEKG